MVVIIHLTTAAFGKQVMQMEAMQVSSSSLEKRCFSRKPLAANFEVLFLGGE